MDIRIREREGCETQPFLLWDSQWVELPFAEQGAVGGYADWSLDGKGGLRSDAALHTAVILQLFSDKRAQEDELYEGQDRRGWWGDSVDIRAELWERDLGSVLWTLERGVLNEQTLIKARDFSEDALFVLIEQGAVARIDVETTADKEHGILEINVQLYGQDDTKIYDERFGLIWNQVERLAA